MIYVTSMLLTAASIAAPAHVQTTSDDVRCLLVSNALIQQTKKDPVRNIAIITSSFYLGRVEGKPPEAIAATLKAQGKITGSAASGIFKACAARVQNADTRIKAAARRMVTGK
jgi:hypothetical protein